MLQSVKVALRITHDAFDEELLDLIEAARSDLVISGVSFDNANNVSDPLIKRAVITYCKANFGLENQDSEKYQESYEKIRNKLSQSGDYNV